MNKYLILLLCGFITSSSSMEVVNNPMRPQIELARQYAECAAYASLQAQLLEFYNKDSKKEIEEKYAIVTSYFFNKAVNTYAVEVAKFNYKLYRVIQFNFNIYK